MEKPKKKKKDEYLYMKVTDDKFELPMAIASSSAELDQMLGYKRGTVKVSMYRAKREGRKCSFVKVKI